MFAGHNNYISDVSEDPKIRAKQLWQFLAGKIFFRLSCISQGKSFCRCDTQCKYKPSMYTLSDYPCNIATDGYTYNHSKLRGCYNYVI